VKSVTGGGSIAGTTNGFDFCVAPLEGTSTVATAAGSWARSVSTSARSRRNDLETSPYSRSSASKDVFGWDPPAELVLPEVAVRAETDGPYDEALGHAQLASHPAQLRAQTGRRLRRFHPTPTGQHC
jgi:hypothetical protein